MKNKVIDEVFSLTLKHGLKKLTMAEIASSLKMSKKTIYEYFDSKDALLESVIDAYINYNYDVFNSELSRCSTTVEELKISCYLFLPSPYEFYKCNIGEIKSLYPEKYNDIQHLIDFKTSTIIKIYEKGVSEGIFDKKINPVIITFMARSFLSAKDFDKSLFESFYEVLLYGCIKKQ